MHNFFSSTFLQNKLAVQKDRALFLSLQQNAPLALSYYLEKEIPKGAIIGLISPKNILFNILPDIAKRKHCKIVLIDAGKGMAKSFKGLMSSKSECDLYICEPELFNLEGAMMHPSETTNMAKINSPLIGVGCTLQITNEKPAHLDFSPLTKIITEKGTINVSSSQPSLAFSQFSSQPF